MLPETKLCRICNTEKLTSEFNKHSNKKDGLQTLCRECQKQYRIDNQERLKHQSKEYRERNKDKIKESKQKYYFENVHEISRKNKIYRENNRENLLLKKRDYYYKTRHISLKKRREDVKHNKEKWSAYYKNQYKKHRARNLLQKSIYQKTEMGKIVGARCRHKRRFRELNSECTLTLDQWNKILDNSPSD